MSRPFCVFLAAATAALGFAWHVRAEPPALWLYCATNLQVEKNIDDLERLWGRTAQAGYTHVLLADSKFARLGGLGDMTGIYMKNLARTKRIAAELKIQVVPALFHIGYSNSMLWHDPNLAEGYPVKEALFVVQNNEARLVADPPVSLPPRPTYKDDCVTIADGVATVRDHQGNARFNYQLKVAPFRCYHVSVSIRTSDFSATPEIKALAGNQSLQWQNLGAKRSQEWKEHHVVFNSLDNTQVTLYFGAWGDATGELQWKDWKIEEAGLVNVLRRPGAPCTVKGYSEGKDYETIQDPRLGNDPWPGEYQAWHEPPSIRTRNLADGTKLRVSWYHPAIIYDGQVGCCLSEPKVMDLVTDEAKRMKAAWGSKGYMMSHDELRTLNWDESCRKRNLDAGAIVSENVGACIRLLAGSEVYTWSDMFDPHHNAVKNYYLVRGDLAGSWEGLGKDVIIMNWNFGKRDESLKFFADRGHRQVIAGYYDGSLGDMRKWIESAGKVKGVVGYMYTTWQGNYKDLEAFARVCRP